MPWYMRYIQLYNYTYIQISLQWMTHCTFSEVQLEKVTNIEEGQADL